jgi:hypothetical protein
MPTENSENSNGHNGTGKNQISIQKENKVKEKVTYDYLYHRNEFRVIDWVEKSVTAWSGKTKRC